MCSGTWSGSTKSPSAWERWTMVPGRACSTRKRETSPSGLARSVIVNRSPARESGLEMVKTRVVRRAPVDLDAELDVLAGAVAAPGRGRLQGDRGDRRVAGDVDLAVHVDDAGADLVGRPHRVDLLEVAVHAVRRGERRDGPGAEDAAGDAHGCLPPIR